MKILVLSDSHSGLRFMRQCTEKTRPDAIVHLGDYYDDGQTLVEWNPQVPVYQVAGNCDRFRCPPDARELLCCPVGGVMLYMTHGHREQVKAGTGLLLAKARSYGARAALYGHTHIPNCHREEDGLWVLNPGSAGYGGGCAGIIETDGQSITACYLLSQTDLEEMA